MAESLGTLPLGPGLSRGTDTLRTCLMTMGFGAGKTDQVPLAVQAGNEHGPVVVIAVRLIGRHQRWFPPFRCHITEALAKTAFTELLSTAEELDRVVGTEGRRGGLHRAKMLVAQRQDVSPHRPSLAPRLVFPRTRLAGLSE